MLKEKVQENLDLTVPGEVPGEWPVCVGSSSHSVPRLSGIFACKVRSKLIMKFLESNVPTRVATTKYVFVFYTSTHGWLISHPEMGNIGCHSSGKGTVRTTSCRTAWPRKKSTWPSAKEDVTIHQCRWCLCPPRCSATKFHGEFHEFGNAFRHRRAPRTCGRSWLLSCRVVPIVRCACQLNSFSHRTHVT